jgi:Peptidase MA superfamily
VILSYVARRAPWALACWALAAALALHFGAGVALAQGAPPGAPQVADAGLTLPGVQGETAALADFGADMRFQIRLRSEEPITSVLFLYQVDDSTVQNTAVPNYQPGTSVVATYSWRVANVLVPGSEVRYQWLVETASGQRGTTAEQKIPYDDTRFSWREASDEGLTVFYPTADPQGSQAGSVLLDEAKKAQTRLKNDFGLTLDRPLRIYAYPRREDYASAVYTGRPLEPSVTVGADRIFVLAPGGTSGMTTAVQGLRREIATAVFVQKTKNAYAEPPRWLATGFSFVMSGEELTPDTTKALGQLAQNNRLLPLRSLGGSFPTDERDLNLAYVESASAVQYLAGAYGPDKLRALLAAFKEGNSVDDAMKKGLGVTLDQFETRWKNALKSGQVARPAGGQQGAQGAANAPAGDGSLVDRVFGPALRYWEGIFGASARPVVIGAGAVIALGVAALVVGSGLSVLRRVRAANEE